MVHEPTRTAAWLRRSVEEQQPAAWHALVGEMGWRGTAEWKLMDAEWGGLLGMQL